MKVLYELKERGSSDEEALSWLDTAKWEMTSAILKSHSLQVARPVPPGSIPIATRAKIRRSASVDRNGRMPGSVWMFRADADHVC